MFSLVVKHMSASLSTEFYFCLFHHFVMKKSVDVIPV